MFMDDLGTVNVCFTFYKELDILRMKNVQKRSYFGENEIKKLLKYDIDYKITWIYEDGTQSQSNIETEPDTKIP